MRDSCPSLNSASGHNLDDRQHHARSGVSDTHFYPNVIYLVQILSEAAQAAQALAQRLQLSPRARAPSHKNVRGRISCAAHTAEFRLSIVCWSSYERREIRAIDSLHYQYPSARRNNALRERHAMQFA